MLKLTKQGDHPSRASGIVVPEMMAAPYPAEIFFLAGTVVCLWIMIVIAVMLVVAGEEEERGLHLLVGWSIHRGVARGEASRAGIVPVPRRVQLRGTVAGQREAWCVLLGW